MYRQPENSNRVKSMKSKFEDLTDTTKKSQNVVNGNFKKVTSKPPVVSSFTKIENNNNNNDHKRSTNKTKENNENIKIERKNKMLKQAEDTTTTTRSKNKFESTKNGTKDFSDINKKELCNVPPLNLTRQLNDPSKKGCIKRTPAFRKDKTAGGKAKVNDDLSFANIVHMFENNDKSNCDTTDNMTKTLSRTYCSDSEIKPDKNTTNINKPKKSITSTCSLNGLTTLNDKNIANKSILSASTSLGLEDNISTLKISDKENHRTKSQPNELLDNILNKKHENETKVILESKQQPVAYAQVNKAKKTIAVETKNVFLTDTLKAALKQPLPSGPPPKKPPRTFAHTPNSKSPSTSTKVEHTTLDTSLNDKLNECLANALKTKNTKSTMTKIKSDPKLMLQKLENALLNNKIKSPKLPRKLTSPKASPSSSSSTQPNIYTTTTSETPQKNLFPSCLTSLNCVTNAIASNSYTKAATSTNNTSSSSMSTFFTDSKGLNDRQQQEPVYAEPFHFLTNTEIENSPKLSKKTRKFDTSMSSLHYMSNPVAEWNTSANTSTTIDCNTNNTSTSDDNNDKDIGINTSASASASCKSVSFNNNESGGPLTRHKLNLIMNNTYASPSPTDSDIDSIPSTPSGEDTPNPSNSNSNTLKRATIKDLILNFEQKNKLEPNTLNIPVQSPSSLSISEELKNLPKDVEEQKKYKTQLSRKLTEIRKTYVRRVCSTIRRKPDLKLNEGKQLFECCLLVGLNVVNLTPYIKNKFPSNYEVPPWVEHLCFPDATEWSTKSTTIPNIQSQDCQCYSLVITNDKGDRKFGYCRRVVPEQTFVCLPLTYCIISRHRATGFYHKVLQELESRHGLPYGLQETFLEKLYNCKFPEPGESVHVPCSLRSLVVESCADMIESNQITNPDSIECISRVANMQNGVYGQLNKSEKCDFRSPKITYGSGVNNNNSDTTATSVGESEVVRRLNPNNSFTGGGSSSSKRNGFIFTSDDNKTTKVSDSSAQYPLLNLSNNQLLNDCLIGDVVLKRPYDSRLEDVDLTALFNTLDLTTLLQTFGSLLHERKVIFISNCLSKLSSCIEALQSILYPFSWQHTFIPVLSNNMLDILSAPLPLIAGVLASHITETLTIDEGIAVNLDTSSLVCYIGDESDIIPKRLQKGLTVALQLVTEATQSNDRSRNVLVSEAFIRMFVEVSGTYKQFIATNEAGRKTFERELFIKHHQAKCVNLFLEWFTETAMFHNFIQNRLESEPSESMFEQRCVELNSEKNSAALLKNSKVTHKIKLFGNKLFH